MRHPYIQDYNNSTDYNSSGHKEILHILHHTKCCTTVLKIAQFKYAINDHFCRLILQIQNSQILRQLICYKRCGKPEKGDDITFNILSIHFPDSILTIIVCPAPAEVTKHIC